jgi:hypothetical protein
MIGTWIASDDSKSVDGILYAVVVTQLEPSAHLQHGWHCRRFWSVESPFSKRLTSLMGSGCDLVGGGENYVPAISKTRTVRCMAEHHGK